MSQTVLKLMEINISVFGHSKMGVDPPPRVKDPNFIHG